MNINCIVGLNHPEIIKLLDIFDVFKLFWKSKNIPRNVLLLADEFDAFGRNHVKAALIVNFKVILID